MDMNAYNTQSAPTRALVKALIAAAVMMVALLAGPGRATANDADPVVDGMQRYYNEVKAYSASFEQVFTEVTGVQSAPARGTVWFMKPGLMRWDYEAPDEKYMISDGETFWIWEPNLQQYCKRDLGSSQLPTALTFLSGQGDIRKEFNVSLKPSKGAGEQRLKLTPQKPSSSYAEIEFVIDEASSQVKRALITDALGNVNSLTFSEPEVNEAIEDADPAHFKFSPPVGATDICAQLNR
jgi:outer membrane lipoprotein carrier protein